MKRLTRVIVTLCIYFLMGNTAAILNCLLPLAAAINLKLRCHRCSFESFEGHEQST